MSQRYRVVACRTCKRSVSIPAPEAEGHPYGWYTVTVNVPLWFNSVNPKPYRYIGLFCSVKCLMAHEQELTEMREMEGSVYEAE